MKNKSDVCDQIRVFLAKLKNKFGIPPKIFRSDQGGEFVNKSVTQIFQDYGIAHQLTAPYTPEENGISERKNRYLQEMAKSMLVDANLEDKYWGEAVMTAAYLQNRLPTKACDVTPYELWNNKKPDVGHIKVFGCQVYTYVPKEKRLKFDCRGQKGIFLGYNENSKTYRVLIINTGRIENSRSVVFLENNQSFGIPSNDSRESNIVEIENHYEDSSEESEVTVPDVQREENVQNEPDTSGEEEEENEPNVSDMQIDNLRRSTRMNKGIPPKRFGESLQTCVEPRDYFEIQKLSNEEQIKWKQAIDEEIMSIESKQVWTLVELPVDKKAIDCKWVFKIKHDQNGNVDRYKARLVAKGYNQIFGIDYEENYSPVAKNITLRSLLTLCGALKYNVKHLDIKTAFLHGDIKEDLYVKQPKGFVKQGYEHYVYKLHKALYGLKQASKSWNDKLNDVLVKNEFERSSADPCLYVKNIGEQYLYLLVYVDDILICYSQESMQDEVQNVLELFGSVFEYRDLGEVSFYLGIQIERNSDGIYSVFQSNKIIEMLEKFGLSDAKPIKIPMLPEHNKGAENSKPLPDNVLYREAIGALLYLSTTTRPDVAAAVGILCRKVSSPTQNDWNGVKNVFRYLRTTVKQKLILDPGKCLIESCWIC